MRRGATCIWHTRQGGQVFCRSAAVFPTLRTANPEPTVTARPRPAGLDYSLETNPRLTGVYDLRDP